MPRMRGVVDIEGPPPNSGWDDAPPSNEQESQDEDFDRFARCGILLGPGTNFCPECGAPVDKAKEIAEKEARAERELQELYGDNWFAKQFASMGKVDVCSFAEAFGVDEDAIDEAEDLDSEEATKQSLLRVILPVIQVGGTLYSQGIKAVKARARELGVSEDEIQSASSATGVGDKKEAILRVLFDHIRKQRHASEANKKGGAWCGTRKQQLGGLVFFAVAVGLMIAGGFILRGYLAGKTKPSYAYECRFSSQGGAPSPPGPPPPPLKPTGYWKCAEYLATGGPARASCLQPPNQNASIFTQYNKCMDCAKAIIMPQAHGCKPDFYPHICGSIYPQSVVNCLQSVSACNKPLTDCMACAMTNWQNLSAANCTMQMLQLGCRPPPPKRTATCLKLPTWEVKNIGKNSTSKFFSQEAQCQTSCRP